MIPYKLDIPPHVADRIRSLPPDIKKSVKEALRGISEDPHLGVPLLRELEGLWKYRVRRYRIVYQPQRLLKKIKIFAVGHRETIYEEVLENNRFPS